MRNSTLRKDHIEVSKAFILSHVPLQQPPQCHPRYDLLSPLPSTSSDTVTWSLNEDVVPGDLQSMKKLEDWEMGEDVPSKGKR